MDKVLCPNCRKLVAYRIVPHMTEREINGEIFEYKEKVAYCSECGEEVYVSGLIDENERIVENLYRKEKDLITIDEIYTIMERYDTDKRPLSVALGFGELTVTRYIAGQLPSKRCSAILKKVLRDHSEMKRYVEENRTELSGVAYRKISDRISEMERLTEIGSKIEAVALYIINSTYEITDLSLQKLLYYVNGFSISLRKTWMFNEDCEAWMHGPVFPDIYEKYKNFGREVISDIYVNDDYLNFLQPEEIELINYVLKCMGIYNGSVLRNLTHTEKPWLIAREGLDDSDRSRNIISQDDIRTFFDDINTKYNLSSPTGVSRYIRSALNLPG